MLATTHLGLELIVVRRAAGGLMERWEARWESSVRRYAALETVRLVLPWSTPSMRFCTSELKTQIIGRELRKRFPNLPLLNVTGVRREESPGRAKLPVGSHDARTSTAKAEVWQWRPIADWTGDEVRQHIADAGLHLHRAYTEFGTSRVSCAFCIMSSGADMAAAARNPDNADLYRRMVDLEIRSTFAFQGARWLGDVASHLLTTEQRAALEGAKARAAERVAVEAELPAHLLFTRGWPTCIPSHEEAELLASVRARVAAAAGIDVEFLDSPAILARYQTLMNAKGPNDASRPKAAAGTQHSFTI